MLLKIISFLLLILYSIPIYAGILINEIACATSGDDWVELFYQSDNNEMIEISHLYITMYYGTNSHLSTEPIHIYSYDRPETPFDDRFIVVHLSKALGNDDETDLTGDTNQNGYIDLYCNNNSLWNTDCVVAIDTDDDPSNDGIIDFVAYSNRDGTPNSTINSYIDHAISFGHWPTYSGNNQECMVDIGSNGLTSSDSIARINSTDNNNMKDFEITKFQTPGRENILSSSYPVNKRLIKVKKKRITFIPHHPIHGTGDIKIFVYNICNIRLRIFSSLGMLLFESPLHKDVYPGEFILNWNQRGLKKKACTGLYLGYIKATSRSLRESNTEKVFIILSNHK
ncbi:MAG: hypothetical protein SVR08_05500 [Spirochaetota bacterium]|nr:hypothetical protein [Spirochaetota bacterium]